MAQAMVAGESGWLVLPSDLTFYRLNLLLSRDAFVALALPKLSSSCMNSINALLQIEL